MKRSDDFDQCDLVSATLIGESAQVPCAHAAEMDCLLTLRGQRRGLRASIDVMIVADLSSSMRGERLRELKASLLFIIDALGSKDRLSIVTFHHKASLEFAFTEQDGAGKARAAKVVNGLTLGVGTHLAAGLESGLEIMRTRNYPRVVSGLFLLTDGEVNIGPNSVDEVRALMDESLSHELKQTIVSTFGYGHHHHPTILRAISKIGRGMYHFIEKPSQITRIFALSLAGLASAMAQNVTIVLESRRSIVSVFLGTVEVKVEASSSVEVDAGSIFDREEILLLVRVFVPPADSCFQEENILSARIQFQLMDGSTQSISRILSIERPLRKGTLAIPGRIIHQRYQIMVSKAIRDALHAMKKGEWLHGQATLGIAMSLLKSVLHIGLTDSLLDDLAQCLQVCHDPVMFEQSGLKVMSGFADMYENQRANGTSGSTSFLSNTQSRFLSSLSGEYQGVSTKGIDWDRLALKCV